MRYTVVVPVFGDTTQSVLIQEWLRSPGDSVEKGTPLVIVETDKTTTEVPSPVAGKLVEHLAATNQEVPTGAPSCVVDTVDEG